MIHQLRIYNIKPELKTEFEDRFKKHAMRIMNSYEFNIIAMWFSEIKGKIEFVYVLEWPDTFTMQKQWEEFMSDKEWDEIKRISREKYGEMVLFKERDQVLNDIDWFNNKIKGEIYAGK